MCLDIWLICMFSYCSMMWPVYQAEGGGAWCGCLWEETCTCESTPVCQREREGQPSWRGGRREETETIIKSWIHIGRWPHLLDSTEPKDSDPSKADNKYLNGRTLSCAGERGLLARIHWGEKLFNLHGKSSICK